MSSPTARSAQLAGILGVFGAVAGPLGARVGVLSPLAGFGLFALALAGGGLTGLVLGILGRRRSGHDDDARRRATIGLVAGLVLLASGLALLPSFGGVPRIHDITTTPDRPPRFVELAVAEANSDRNLSYPHGGADVVEQPRDAYPDLAPVELELSADDAWRRALKTVESLGWRVIAADLESGRIEATDVSRIFRFVDDVVIEVEPHGAGESRVHVRSTSRVGKSDLGANAERIRRFAAAVAATP